MDHPDYLKRVAAQKTPPFLYVVSMSMKEEIIEQLKEILRGKYERRSEIRKDLLRRFREFIPEAQDPRNEEDSDVTSLELNVPDNDQEYYTKEEIAQAKFDLEFPGDRELAEKKKRKKGGFLANGEEKENDTSKSAEAVQDFDRMINQKI